MVFGRVLVCSLIGCSLSAYVLEAAELAVPKDYEGRTIQAIRFDPPVQPLEAADLKRALVLETGTPLKLEDVRSAIRRLYATGVYQDIEVTWEPDPKGVALVIRTTEQWFVGPVEVRG